MGVFEQFPYTNFHDLNLDWVINTIKAMQSDFTNFISQNAIKYADPIQWDITTQYEKNTVVVDITGNGYLSVKAVPGGISIDRTEYWTVIGNFSALWGSVRNGITLEDEGHSATATKTRGVGDLVWLGDVLIEVTSDMSIGTAYAIGTNCINYSMQMLLDSLANEITTRANADTTLQTSITNETTARTNADTILQTNITNEATTRANADTTLQTNITNETTARTNADITLQTNITNEATTRSNADTTLQTSITNETTARTNADNAIIAKFDFNLKDYGAVGDGLTDDTVSIQNAIAACPNYGTIDGKGKTYLVTHLEIQRNNISFININLKMKATSNTYYSGFSIGAYDNTNTYSNINFFNVNIDGNRTAQSYTTGYEDGGKCGFRLIGNINNIKLINCSANYCYTDGLEMFQGMGIISGTSDIATVNNVIVENCEFSWNRRHGASGCSLGNVKFINCKFNNNGKDINGGVTEGDKGAKQLGARYANGFDMEGYGVGSYIENIVFDKCEFLSNIRQGLLFTDPVDQLTSGFAPRKNITILNCHMDKGVEPDDGSCLGFTSTIANKAKTSLYKNISIINCILENPLILRCVSGVNIQSCHLINGIGLADYALNVNISNNNGNATFEQYNSTINNLAISEGNWIPDLQFSDAKVGITYATQIGKYSKISKVVTVSAQIVLTSKGSSIGLTRIYGLPFVASTTGTISIYVESLDATAVGTIQGVISQDRSDILLTKYSAGVMQYLQQSHVSNNSTFIVSASYLTY